MMMFTGRIVSENTAGNKVTPSEAVEMSISNSVAIGVMIAPMLRKKPATTMWLIPNSPRFSQARVPSLMNLAGEFSMRTLSGE